MNCLKKLIRPYRIVVPSANSILANVSKGIRCTNFARVFTSNFYTFNTRNMSQKSITSFFKITPKKEGEVKKEKLIEDDSPSQDITINKSPTKTASGSPKSPVFNGKEKRTSKRQRLDSSGSEPQSPKSSEPASPPLSSGKKKKIKRQRIESSSSEAESQLEDKTPKVKLEKTDKPKTYDSPKSKKTKIKAEKSPLVEKNEVVKKKSSPNVEKSSPKVEKSSPNVEKSSPKVEKSSAKVKKSSQKKIKLEKEKSTEKVTEVKEKKEVKSMNFFFKKENGESEKEKKTDKDRVSEEDYNPAKPKYHPIKDACWSQGEPVPYLALAKTLEAIEGTSARLKIIEILSNYLRSVIALTPEDLLPSVYMCLNQLAPAYHSLELGIAETYLMKAIGQSTGRTLSQMRAAAARTGDLGEVAQQARAAQRTMFAVSRLSAGKLFCKLKEIAAITGQDSVNKKISMIQSLYIACRSCEAKYLIRSLEGKLRIGLAEQSVLQALALATTLTPPAPDGGVTTLDASKGLSAEQFKAKVDAQSLLIKTTYCECPNYELVIPALLQHGAAALPQHCRLTPGIPLKPMLAHPTKGISEVFNRFEGEQFTCEWKYDGERAQIHVPADTRTDTDTDTEPDLRRASVFSRNQENNTSKYPDVLSRLSSLLKPSVTSCVLDTEAVAFDVTTQKILPFQILSTRKRKDAVEADIKVQVCVFVFDLLYLNGAPLVREPLAERRRLLREHFYEVPGQWQFATSRDCSSLEEVQQFLDESIKGSCEGLMVKTLTGEHARYDIARRSHNWLKLKKDYLEGCGDTIDVVVIGAYNGRGKRARVFGGFLLACYEPDTEEYQSLCKIGTGFTDEDLVTLSEKLKDCVIDAPRNYYRYDSSHTPDVWLSPSHVWEVRCADLSLSPAHRAAIGTVDPDKGISLRFPRYLRERDDKTPEQATSARQIADMYLAQDVVKNHAPKHGLSDDFY